MKETRSVEFQEWNIKFLRIMWLVTGLAFAVAFVLFLGFDDTQNCSRQTYFMTFVAVPALMQSVICIGMEIFVRKISTHVPNSITAMFVAMGLELLCGILVMVHTSVGEMAIALVVPLVLAGVYNNRLILLVQALLAFVIYVTTQLVIIPRGSYMPKNSSSVYILIFAGLLIAVMSWINMMIHWRIEMTGEVERYREREQLQQQQTMIDSLTGLWNHKAFNEMLEERMKQLSAAPGKCILVLFDIDSLYRVNEQYGYINGDKVIVKLAEIIRRNVRTMDYVARYNGEEFMLVLNEVSLEMGEKIAGRIQQQFAACVFEDCGNMQYTVSAGVAPWYGGYTTLAFVSKVEQALRSAKLLGYGMSCTYEEEQL